MSIDPGAINRLPWRAISALLALVLALASQGQEGQYRSKIRIDPAGDVNQGAGLSIDELEQQIDSISDSYAKSSAGRHLARHFVEQGQYDKAIEYYQTALAASGLSDIANREMLRELAQVYLLSKNYEAAASALERVLRIKLVPDTADYLLLAQAYYRLGKLVQVVSTLDPLLDMKRALSVPQQRQALALYYQAGAYAQCERLLRQLLDAEPDNPDSWHQLAAVYLQQGKRKQALDQLALAREKSVPFREQDIVLLADLQAVNGNPYGAAELLQDALAQQTIAANGLNYRKLFQFWLQARENDRAGAALVQAARLSGDIELYLYLAQLQMEQEAWQPMYQTMLAACKGPLQDKYVGRANLLLGISQLKLGDESSARRSFINATLIGGVGAQAGQWLEFMKAAPATDREARGIVGICHGPGDKQLATAALAAQDDGQSAATAADTSSTPTPAAPPVETKTVPGMRFFYLEYNKPLAQLATEAKSLALAMGVALVKGGGTVDGPLQIIAQGEGDGGVLQLGFPYRGSPRGGGKYQTRVTGEFKCAYLVHEGRVDSLADLWATLLASVEQAGYELTAERRVLLHVTRGGGERATRLELQIGVK
jgi:tetratricopeptide (TPR) repeat protein